MKRLRNAIGVAVLAGLVAHPAWATGVYHLKLAGAEIESNTACAGSTNCCSRVSRAIPTSSPYTAINCQQPATSNVSFSYSTVYPTDQTNAAAGFTFKTKQLIPDGSVVAGNMCQTVCMAAIAPGQSRNAAVFTCLANAVTMSTPGLAQYVEFDELSQGTPPLQSIVPKDTAATACSATNCAGYELIIKVLKFASNVCASASTSSIDYLSGDLTYQ